MRVAFLGLGSMGAPMAANLARAGHDLVVWNRSARQPEGFDAPPRRAGSIEEAVRAAEVAATMLADDAAVDAVVAGGLLAALGEGAVHLSMSTISIAAARRLAEAHAARGRDYVAAPVFGRPDIAAAGKLWIALAGPAAGCARVRPLLDAMGRGVTELGETAWHANLVKLGNNMLLAAMIEALGETIAMMRRAGVEPQRFLDAVGALFASPVYANYGRQIAERRHEPAGFQARLGLKDVRLALTAADELGVPLPTAGLAHDNLLAAVAAGMAAQDWTVLAAVAQRRAGLE